MSTQLEHNSNLALLDYLQPSEEPDIRDSPAVGEFSRRLSICIEQAINQVAATDHNYRDGSSRIVEDGPIAQHIKSLQLKIDNILVECIAVFLRFNGSDDQERFFLQVLLGKFVYDLQKLILSVNLRQRFVYLDNDTKGSDGALLSNEQRQLTLDFLGKVFDNIRITVWMSVADLLKLGKGTSQDNILKMKISGPTMKPLTRGSSGVKRIPSGPQNTVIEVCQLLIETATDGPEQMRTLQSRLLNYLPKGE